MKFDDTWSEFNPFDYLKNSERSYLSDWALKGLETQSKKWLEAIEGPCFLRTGTPERISKDKNNPKQHTELYIKRLNSNGKLFICIGESFTWCEGLYGLASGATPPILNPLIQMFFTFQGRIAQKFNSDLRTVTYPGNSNTLMLQALDRVLLEIQNDESLKSRYNEIVILQQFTDRSRCEYGHPETPWINSVYQSQANKKILNDSRYVDFEKFLVYRLNLILNKHKNLPLKCHVWRNFNPWISEWSFDNINKIALSMSEFKFLIQGLEVLEHPINCSSQFYLNKITGVLSTEELEWLNSEIDKAEILFKFLYDNELGGHPKAELCIMWAKYLIDQGVKFDNQ